MRLVQMIYSHAICCAIHIVVRGSLSFIIWVSSLDGVNTIRFAAHERTILLAIIRYRMCVVLMHEGQIQTERSMYPLFTEYSMYDVHGYIVTKRPRMP